MIVYIAGKISGNPEYKKQFAAAAARLRQQGIMAKHRAWK